MYYATYGSEYLHDPFSENQVVSDLSINGKVNAQGSCDFTIAPSHPLYDKLKIRDLSEPVRIYEDSTCLFDGYVYQVEDQFDKSRNVSCNGSLSYLGDSVVRPYATVKSDDDQPGMLYSGSSAGGLFSWYIDQHNQHTDSVKHFVVGKNEGSQLDSNDKIYRSNVNYPTTSSEIEDKLLNTLGGYIFTRYENDTRYIDYFADCVDVNAQVIDFGVNITDYTKSDTSESMYTVLIPQGATPESKDDSNKKQYPIDIKSIPDGQTSISGIYKSGDHIYDKEAVDKYGMIEKFETFSDIYDPENLLKAAALSLKTQSTPVTKIEVKAVDLSLYMDNYKPLVPGQLVRIRSIPHNIDTYMLLSEMAIDIDDPSNTTYTFGITYDTLTGQQSKRIQELNSSINESLDTVASIDQATKDNAVAVGAATKIANDAKNTANTANDTANTAKDTADTAQKTADTANATATTAKDTANKAQSTATEAKATADSANNAAAELKKKTAEIDKQVEAVSAKADQVRTDLTQQVQNVKSEMDSAVEAAQTSANEAQSAADAAQEAADKANASTVDLDKSIKAVDAKAIAAKQAAAEAQSKAENVASDLDSANAVIEQHTTELGELTTKVTNAVNDSESALSVSTEAKQTATEASTTATSAYADAQTALTQSTTATQTATTAKTTAESASKTASDSLKQSSAAVQTANQISTTLRTEYQTKADADKLYATQSSLKQTSDSITASVSKTYATKDALSALQNVADNAIESWRGTGVPTLTNKPASDWTTNADKKKHSGDLYYDKSTGKAYRFGSDDGETYTWELNQDTDVTKALENAAKAQTSANNAQASATAANTAADNAQSTANTAVSNAATAKNAADAAQSSANKAQGDVDKLKIDIPETYATKSSLTQTAESITANVESVKATANSAVTAASNAQQTADGISANLTQNYQTKSQADTIYATKASLKATSDSISAEVAKAQGTADGAVTAASKAQQTADAVTLNLSKNYQTKAQNDALYATQTSLKATSDSLSANITANANTAQSAVDKATSLEANLNGFKTTVSDTYMAKGIGDEIIENGIPNPDRPNTFGLEIVDGVFQRTFPGREKHVDYGPHQIMHTIGPYRTIRMAIDVRLVSGKDTISDTDYVNALGINVNWVTIQVKLKDIVDGEWHSYEKYLNIKNDTVTSAFASSFVGSDGVKVLQFRNASIKDVTSDYKSYSTKSELTQTANSIKAEVSETYTTKNDFNNLTIGGTNRIILTGVKSGRIDMNGNVVVNGGEPDHCITIPVSAEPNTKYTISGSIPTPSNSYVSVAFYDENGQFISRPTGAYTVTEAPWKNTFTSPANAVTVKSSFPVIFKGKIKLEKGDKPTDWSPAPEDLQPAGDYATNSSLTQTANSIKAEVAETYTTKNDVGVGNLIKNGDFSDGMTNWTTNGGTSKIVDGTYGKQFVFTQTGTNTNGSNRIYNDTHKHINGQAYVVSFYAKADKSSKWHFGPTGSPKAASTTLDTTLKQYAMQYQADNTTVFSVWTDNPTATIHLERVKLSVASGYYATNSSLTQTANSIKAEVTEVSKTANGALTKATTVEQTANGLSTKITEQGKTLNATVTTANEAKSTADSNKTAISQTANLVDAALAGDNLITDGGFESTEWWKGLKNPFRISTGSLYHGKHVLVCDGATGDNRCPLTHEKGMAGSATTIPVTKGRTYRLSGYCAWYESVPSNVDPSAEKLRLAKPDGSFIAEAPCSKSTSWSETHVDWKCPDDGSITSVKIEVMHQTNGTILWDDVAFRDITEAAATSNRVSSVEQNLNGFKTTVAETYQTKSGMSDYATNSSLTQTANSIKAEVTEVSKTANNAMSKATTVEQTTNGLQTTVTEQAKKLDDAVTTTSQVTQRVDSLSSTITQVQGDVNSLNASVRLINPSFETGDTTGWKFFGYQNEPYVNNVDPRSGTYKLVFPSINYDGKISLENDAKFPVKAGEVYRISLSVNPDSTIPSVSGTILMVSVGLKFSDDSIMAYNPQFSSGWHEYSGTVTIPSGKTEAHFLLDMNVKAGNTVRVDSVLIENISDAKTATDTANSAISKSSSVEQNLNSFKTTVSETYTTKNDFNDLTIGGRNLLLNSNFSKGTDNWVLELQNAGRGTVKAEALSGVDFAKTMLTINVTNNTSGQCRIYQSRSPNPMRTDTVDTISFWATASETVDAFFGPLDDAKIVTVEPGWHYYKATVPKWTKSMAFSIGVKTGFVGTLKITNIMWEHASKASQWSPAPEDLQPAGDYSTKSYVDQTAKSVALGVVQNYKGADGSGLATKSDITVTKDSITSTVANTYATKSGVTQEISSKITQNNDSLDVKFATKTETQEAQNTANTANSNATNAQSRVGNIEDCITLTSNGVRAGKQSNGVFTGVSALVNSDGSFDLLDSDGQLLTRIDQHTFRVAGDSGVGAGYITLSQDGINITVMPTDDPDKQYYIRIGSGGISLTSPDGAKMECSAMWGMALDTKQYGKLAIGPLGLQFTNDQGWGLKLSANGWSLNWDGNHKIATGPTDGKLYIDGHEIVTK